MNELSLSRVINKFDNKTSFYVVLIYSWFYSQPVTKGSITMARMLEIAKIVQWIYDTSSYLITDLWF